MYRYTLLAIAISICTLSTAQEDTLRTDVETMPQFPGGNEALFKYLSTSVEYPLDAANEGVTGTTYLTFVVERDGSIEHAKVTKGFDARCDSAALAAVLAMPKWEPGMNNGDSVRVKYNLPVQFNLPEPVEEK